VEEVPTDQQPLAIHPRIASQRNMKQQMVDRLFLLVTDGATVRVVHAAPGQPITSPAPVVLNQPHEKFTFFRSPRFSNYLCRLKANSPLEEGCIHRSG
jgi:hypothetical protein